MSEGDPTQRRGFYCIDNELLRTYGPQLGPFGIAVLNVIMMHANGDGECWPSHQTIAEIAGMSRRQVMREVEKLIELGLVKLEPRAKNGMKQSHIYRICRCDTQSQRCDRESPGCDTQSLNDVTGSPLRCDRESHKQDPLEQDPLEQDPEEEVCESDPLRATQPAAKPPPAPPSPPKKGAKVIKSPHFKNEDFNGMYIPAGEGVNPVQVYYERFNIFNPDERLTAIKEDDLVRQCPDLERLREAVTVYSQTNYKPGNIKLILDWYNAGPPVHRGPTNGNGNGRLGTERPQKSMGGYALDRVAAMLKEQGIEI